MKKILSFMLVLVMLIGVMPVQVFATEGIRETEHLEVVAEPAEVTEVPEKVTEVPEEEVTVVHEYERTAEVTEPAWGTWVAFGTSITEDKDYMRPNATNIKGTYIPYLSKLMGVDAPDANYSIGGAAFSTHLLMYIYYGNYQKKGLIYNGYTHTAIKNADLITIEGGVNDFYGSVPLGNVGDTLPYSKADPVSVNVNSTNNFGGSTEGTFAGCIYAAITELRRVAPNATIVFITDNAGTGSCAATKANALGHYLHDYNDIMTAVAESMGCYVIDAGRTAGFEENLKAYLSDHIHHSEAGGEAYANAIWKGLCAIQNGEKPESGHTHRYTESMTAPTCTEQGYTTYTCICGDSYVGDYTDATGEHSYENGACAGCGEKEPITAIPMSMRYDDHLDMTGKTVEILDAGKPTSYQVGYGVEGNAVLDTAVVTMKSNTLVATGIGTATVKIDGEIYEITVTAAPISLLLLIGQSNAEGMEGNANQSVVCPDGMVYSTYAKSNGLTGDAGLTVENAGNYVPSSLTGTYSTINVNGTNTKLGAYPVDSLTAAGTGKYGMDSGLAYEWVKQTGEKVWVVNAAHGASGITSWQKGADNYDQAIALFTACQQVLQKEISAGHYIFSHMGYYWNQGCADETKTAEWYVKQYLSMHENLKADLACDMDNNPATANNTFEFSNIVLVQAGHSTASGYRKGTYQDTSDSFFMTYKELELRGPRVAQIWMANNPELTDIHIVSTLAQDWVTMPDGSDGVAEYFQSAYKNGTVDYTTQVKQSASWYKPTTPAAVKDSIHYNQIGYNEIGRESARNTLYILGILERPDVETKVTFLNWTGYEPAESLKTSGVGTSDTLVVPLVYPCYESKTVTYTLSDGLTWSYYDLLDTGVDGGNLTASIGTQAVTVTGREYYSYRFELVDGKMVSISDDTFRENLLTATTVNTYTLADTILLKHDKQWVMEFNSVAADRFMALASSKSTVEGMHYFFKSNSGTGVLAMGEYKDGLYQNYGLLQSQISVDWGKSHVYRFENVINADGSNVIHIYVDGQWAGTATNLIINSKLQNTDNMYLSGKDFSFSSIGCSGFGFANDQMTYLEIWENHHNHNYVDGICTTCGEVQPGPVIIRQAESIEQEIGKKFAITVKAEGEELTYQWYYKNAGGKTFAASSNKTSSYAYTMQSYMHNRQVYCVITDKYGNSVQTETATITRPPLALKITEQPQGVQVNVGEKFSISPKVEGDGLTYQWYVKESGAKAWKVSSNKTSAYAYTMASYMNGRQVYCVITDQYGNQVTTDVATISLPPVELKILTQPTDASAPVGTKFSISFEVQGDGLTYQWYYRNAGGKTFAASSNKTSAYAYSMASYMNNRQVYCVITDQYGNQVTTETVTIHVTK